MKLDCGECTHFIDKEAKAREAEVTSKAAWEGHGLDDNGYQNQDFPNSGLLLGSLEGQIWISDE